jgi:DNA-binding NarL/FixJ family response regulator
MSLPQVHFGSPRGPQFASEEPSGLRPALLAGDRGEWLASSSLRSRALQADDDALPSSDLSSVWQDVIAGRVTICGEGGSLRRHYMLARTKAGAEVTTRCGALSRIETSVLVRVLCGEQQKLVAVELGMACSTASKWYTHALTKLHLAGAAPIPLPLVIAAQTWASGSAPAVGARIATFEHEGGAFLLLSIPKPEIVGDTCLTIAEQEVAKLLVSGVSRSEIAMLRSTSTQTVACQLRCIFSKYRLTGRNELISRAVALGWFR